MISNNLIKKCVCGNNQDLTTLFVNMLEVVSCGKCGVIHQHLNGWTPEDYYNFYKNDYHKSYQEKKGVVTYQDRYEHDCHVADMRLDAYNLHTGSIGLDIGSSNSAFVHQARARNLQCLGLEPGDSIGDDSVTIRGTLESCYLNTDHFDFVTMHDSIEHMIDVNSALQKVHLILKQNGKLILDLPDYFNKAGKHHWKPIEHLWFFTEEQFVKIIKSHGFLFDKVTRPIPGKLVFYSRKV
jgi:SAM-dependent methyltransferase